PSLKPFTAPPRSCPMLRSFFVPKISTTTSNTISQCQMLKPPMMFSSVLVLAARQHSPERFRSADDVQVDVHHLLPSDASGVDDRPESLRRALFACESARKGQHPAEYRRVVRRRLRERCDMALWHQHEMHRRVRRPDRAREKRAARGTGTTDRQPRR